MRRYTLTIGEREFVVDVDDLAADRFAVQVGIEKKLASTRIIGNTETDRQRPESYRRRQGYKLWRTS